jgi:putative membrane protein
MDQNLTSFSDNWGGAERIMKTPVPFAYAHHIKAFLILFAFTAPFALVESMGWMTPVASAVLAFALFGIDEIAVEIEDPFGYDENDLPLDAVGETIDRDVGDIAALSDPPVPRAVAGG